MNSRNNPLYNPSGYRDPTAFRAIKEADGSRSKKLNPNLKEPSRGCANGTTSERKSERDECDRNAERLIKAVKLMLAASGFSLIHRIEIRHDKSGREYR